MFAILYFYLFRIVYMLIAFNEREKSFNSMEAFTSFCAMLVSFVIYSNMKPYKSSILIALIFIITSLLVRCFYTKSGSRPDQKTDTYRGRIGIIDPVWMTLLGISLGGIIFIQDLVPFNKAN